MFTAWKWANPPIGLHSPKSIKRQHDSAYTTSIIKVKKNMQVRKPWKNPQSSISTHPSLHSWTWEVHATGRKGRCRQTLPGPLSASTSQPHEATKLPCAANMSSKYSSSHNVSYLQETHSRPGEKGRRPGGPEARFQNACPLPLDCSIIFPIMWRSCKDFKRLF